MTGKLNKVFGKTPEKKEVSGVFSWNGCKNFGFAFLLVMILIGCTGHFVFAEDMREAGSAPNVSVVYEDQYEIPEGFEFSVQIQKDKNGTIITEFVPFGSWDNKEKRVAELDEDAVITRITDESKKGLIGGWYYNVGIYDGKIVDLKCTIEDYQQTTNEISGKASLGWIALSAEHLGIYQNYMEWVELRMEFFDSRTGEPLEVTGTAVITDIDRYEGMAILSEYEHILLAEDCRLEQTALEENYILFKETEGKCAADENEDDWALVQVVFTSDIFVIDPIVRMRILESINGSILWLTAVGFLIAAMRQWRLYLIFRVIQIVVWCLFCQGMYRWQYPMGMKTMQLHAF